MTSKELKRLRRTDLMEMLLELSKENVELRRQLDEANAKLADRQIQVENAGSLAEAALQLNGIFAAAQAACEQYEYNVRLRSRQLEEQISRETPAAQPGKTAKRRGKRRAKKKE